MKNKPDGKCASCKTQENRKVVILLFCGSNKLKSFVTWAVNQLYLMSLILKRNFEHFWDINMWLDWSEN